MLLASPSVPPAVEDQKAPLSARRHGGFLRLGASHRKKLIVWKSSKKARQDESQDFSSRLHLVLVLFTGTKPPATAAMRAAEIKAACML